MASALQTLREQLYLPQTRHFSPRLEVLVGQAQTCASAVPRLSAPSFYRPLGLPVLGPPMSESLERRLSR